MNRGLDYGLDYRSVQRNAISGFRNQGLDYRSARGNAISGFRNRGLDYRLDYKAKAGPTQAPKGPTKAPSKDEQFGGQVNCGNHLASSCSNCLQGNG